VRDDRPALIVEEITDPVVLAAARAQWQRFDRNSAWLEAHGDEIFLQYPGKCICIAGQEVFAADSSPEAIALARAAHPDDDGWFVYRVPTEKLIRIYAN
jgi:hypothetical protein